MHRMLLLFAILFSSNEVVTAVSLGLHDDSPGWLCHMAGSWQVVGGGGEELLKEGSVEGWGVFWL